MSAVITTRRINRTCILRVYSSTCRYVVALNAFDIFVCGAVAWSSLRRLEEGGLDPLHVRKLTLVEVEHRRIHFECLVWSFVALRVIKSLYKLKC